MLHSFEQIEVRLAVLILSPAPTQTPRQPVKLPIELAQKEAERLRSNSRIRAVGRGEGGLREVRAPARDALELRLSQRLQVVLAKTVRVYLIDAQRTS